MATPSSADVSSSAAGSSSHPPCRLGFGGFLQYRPPIGSPEAEVLRREPEQHLSVLNISMNRRLEARGGGREVHKWFLALPEPARELVRAVGFEMFILGLNLLKIDWSLMTLLVKRWWDTTNTFHIPSAGEMMITLGDFSLLTGLRVSRAPLLVDPRLWERIGALEWFLGKVPPLHSRGHVDIYWLSKTFMKTDILAQVSVEQFARAFLLYLLGQTLFANKDSLVHTQFLAPLQLLEAVWEFDWGAPALATLYSNLGACSRDKSPILGSHYWVLELWAFKHLLQFPTETKHEDVSCIPHYERWLAGQRKPRSPILSLLEWWRVLDRLMVNQVRFDPWGGVPEDAPLMRSRVPAEVVQEWLHAYQSAEALVQRQCRRILELEAERVPATCGEDAGASERSLTQRSSQRRHHD
ncbi:protein MAINTENANCE OF MERISTEMS-like [Rhododendron vialii]|uniref:protein MAINTENANCE OF MERISTEMS-like n=1 Tax=Rhododendron vialii TaxID=182163 RepID=UPI00265FCEFB|nr:protein MAINTENANCE OF MERISTEMS-like [Rhododendron vialii]